MPTAFSPMNYPGMRRGSLSMRPQLPVGPNPAFSGLPPEPQSMTSTPPQIPMPPPASPMTPVPSGQNHSYGGGIADRATRPVGRSMYDLNRIAQQTYRRTKDPSMLFAMDWRNRTYPQPGATPPVPTIPGQSSPAAAAPTGAPPLVPDMKPLPIGGLSAADVPTAPAPLYPQPPQAPGDLPPSPLTSPLPGLTTQAPQPPTYDNKNPLPLIPTPEEVRKHDLVPDYTKMQTYNGKQYPTFVPRTPQKPEVPKIFNEGGQEVIDPKTGAKTLTPVKHYYFELDANNQPVKRYVGEGGQKAAASAAPTQQSGNVGGYQYKAREAAPQASAPAAPASQPSPMEFLTGQVPQADHASPLTPAQSLTAARDHYAATGDASKLQQHFKAFPSQAVQYGQKEQAVWDKIGQGVHASLRLTQAQQRALTARDVYLKSVPYAAQGAAAQAWAASHPQEAALIQNITWEDPTARSQMMDEAAHLSKQAQAARAGLPIPADYDPPTMVDPHYGPSPMPMPGFMQTLGQMPGRALQGVQTFLTPQGRPPAVRPARPKLPGAFRA